MKLSENIRFYRQKKDMTQEQLAEALGVSAQAVSRWETESTYPDIALLPTIACFFNVSLDDLMGMKEFRDEKDLEEVWEKLREFGNLPFPCVSLCTGKWGTRKKPLN